MFLRITEFIFCVFKTPTPALPHPSLPRCCSAVGGRRGRRVQGIRGGLRASRAAGGGGRAVQQLRRVHAQPLPGLRLRGATAAALVHRRRASEGASSFPCHGPIRRGARRRRASNRSNRSNRNNRNNRSNRRTRTRRALQGERVDRREFAAAGGHEGARGLRVVPGQGMDVC